MTTVEPITCISHRIVWYFFITTLLYIGRLKIIQIWGKKKVQQQQNNKKTKPEEKNAFSCGSLASIMFSLYKAGANFLPMEHVNSR